MKVREKIPFAKWDQFVTLLFKYEGRWLINPEKAKNKEYFTVNYEIPENHVEDFCRIKSRIFSVAVVEKRKDQWWRKLLRRIFIWK